MTRGRKVNFHRHREPSTSKEQMLPRPSDRNFTMALWIAASGLTVFIAWTMMAQYRLTSHVHIPLGWLFNDLVVVGLAIAMTVSTRPRKK